LNLLEPGLIPEKAFFILSSIAGAYPANLNGGGSTGFVVPPPTFITANRKEAGFPAIKIGQAVTF
jgi:hypothetical protein